MQNAETIRLRDEYSALLRVAEGLIEMIRRQQACNTLTIAHMADQARAAARRIASMIERLIIEERPAPVKERKASVFCRVVAAVKAVVAALVA